MTNFQAELPRYFKNREDLVCFESVEELVELCGYYLAHDEERRQIAASGYEKVKKHHTYEKRIRMMMETVRNDAGDAQ